MKTLGEKIRYFRNLKGWSQEETAHRLDISYPAYSRIERNETDVQFSRLTQIAKLFGKSIVDLLSAPNKPEQSELEKLLLEKEQEINRLQKRIIELMGGSSKTKRKR